MASFAVTNAMRERDYNDVLRPILLRVVTYAERHLLDHPGIAADIGRLRGALPGVSPA